MRRPVALPRARLLALLLAGAAFASSGVLGQALPSSSSSSSLVQGGASVPVARDASGQLVLDGAARDDRSVAAAAPVETPEEEQEEAVKRPQLVPSTTTTTAAEGPAPPPPARGPPAEPSSSSSAAAAAAGDVTVSAMPSELTEMMRMHSVYRTKHQAPNLVWDDAVASRAASTVAGCVAEYNPQVSLCSFVFEGFLLLLITLFVFFSEGVAAKKGGFGGFLGCRLSRFARVRACAHKTPPPPKHTHPKIPQGDGQNLAYTSNPDLQLGLNWTVNAWYNDIQYYSWSDPEGTGMNAALFTQLVWVSSQKVGCAYKRCLAGTVSPTRDVWLVACNYSPMGNNQGQFAANVLQVGGSPPPPPPPPIDYSEILAMTNKYRSWHSAAPLVWDQTLADHAANTGNFKNCIFEHDPSLTELGEGENLAWTTDLSPTKALNWSNNYWYNEVSLYDFNNPGFAKETGHFTQVRLFLLREREF